MSNRAIKFRVWRDSFSIQNDHYDGSWLPNRYIGSDGKVYLDDYGLCSEHYVEDYGSHLHVERFTGLMDKNGREIYEGDVVKIHEFREYLGESYPGQYIVWPEYIFSVEWKGPDRGYGIGYFSHRRQGIEIIGNIHENPELLKP